MLTITDLYKTYRGAASPAVRGVSFEVPRGAMVSLLGPSGCGKTTTLRCVAGLETPDSGEIVLADRVLDSVSRGVSVPVHRRGLGMVFQSYAIWPHMSVLDNVRFPLQTLPRSERVSRAEQTRRVEEALDLVQLGRFAARRATDLSGGQQQRLALARALVGRPPLLLLDEPLSNLDARLRDEMRFELLRLQSELGITTVFVTHDQAEALALSDAIVLMNDGVIAQVGTPTELYRRPASRFVASFIGRTNLWDGDVLDEPGVDGLVTVGTPLGPLRGVVGADGVRRGGPAVLACRPEQMAIEDIETAAPRSRNAVEAVVKSSIFTGDAAESVLEAGRVELRVRHAPDNRHAPGDRVLVRFTPGDCIVLPSGAEADSTDGVPERELVG
ncbi:ABC transporter ATP-binding protein [Pseudonocardia kujensis]|uniref:ABC transporter ATP-binding protein n=1 Tax=Pseudonocardia kujensis TaxID=1128675 RepID=UPI001E5D9FE6|nr:ABC transporter ATP-binding protein [Pseudonocardia kujensis]MCE0762043.1 ABC transporter ATP-binding protein [Pseudonocardia kujensis]